MITLNIPIEDILEFTARIVIAISFVVSFCCVAWRADKFINEGRYTIGIIISILAIILATGTAMALSYVAMFFSPTGGSIQP